MIGAARPARLDGRVVVLTGAAGGIGRALAARLLAGGANLLASDLDAEAARAALGDASPEQADARTLDVRDPDGWRAVLGEARERWGRIDLLLNVAGFLRPGRTYEQPVEDLILHLDVNARGVLLGTRLAGELMVQQGAGHVVNVGSMASLAPIPGIGAYSAAKCAVRAFSLVAAQELRPRGVAVTLVCPDAVQTPMLDLQVDYAEAALTFSGPRVLTADEVAAAILSRGTLDARPFEVWLPRRRGWLAKVGDVLPGVGFRVGEVLARRGLAVQAKRRTSP